MPATAAPTSSATNRTTYLLLALVLAFAGLGLSVYSTLHHLDVHANGHTDAACNISAKFSCDEVALSKYSEIAGIPLGVLGAGYFIALAVLLFTALLEAKSATEHLHGYTALVLVGVLTSIGLGGISVGFLGTYCLVCIGVYIVTLLQAALLFVGRTAMIPPGFSAKSVGNGATSALIAVAVVVAAFNFLKPSHSPEKLDLPQSATGESGSDRPALAPKVENIPLTKSAYAGLGEDYRKGGDQAKVVVMEFADFQCPACRHVAETLEQLHKEYGDRVLFVYRNYPLDNSCNSSLPNKMHEFSCKAAVMARCAGIYGKFWEFHNRLFANQQSITNETLHSWAGELGLSPEQIATCWDSKDLLAKVQDDIAIGNHLGIDSTPSVYINGRKVIGGQSLEDLRSQINEALN